MSAPSAIVSDPNFFSHFVIMGINSIPSTITLDDIKKGSLQPTILQTYPFSSSEDQSYPLYLSNLSLWAFTDGFKIMNADKKVIYSSENNDRYILNPEKISSMNTSKEIHSFIITDENYNRRYCSALTFHELYMLQNEDEPSLSPLDIHRNSIYVPKAIIIVSETSCFDAQKQFLKYLKKTVVPDNNNIKPKSDKYIKIPSKYLQNYLPLPNPCLDEILVDENEQEKVMQSEIESQKLIREDQLLEFCISAAYLLFPKITVAKNIKERVLFAPRGGPEKSEEALVRFRAQNLFGLEIPSTSFKKLFKQLSARNLIRIAKGILLERQLIFFSSQPEEIPYITEALLSLLSPMKWRCIYVPSLPIIMWETLHAVMPYIVGIAAKYKEFIATHIDLTDKIVVDLDNDALYIGEDTYDIPKKPKEFIIGRMEQLCKGKKHSTLKKSAEFWAESALKAKHYFRALLIMLTNNYISFFKSIPNVPSKKQITSMSASEVFDFQAYFSCLDEEHEIFMQEAQHTMIFTHFIEETYEILYRQPTQDRHELRMFIDDIVKIIHIFAFSNQHQKKKSFILDLCNSKVTSYIDMIHDNWIKESMNKFRQPEKISLLPYLGRYYSEFSKEFDEISKRDSISWENLFSGADEEKAKAKALIDKKNHFKLLEREKLAELQKIFTSELPHLTSSSPTGSHDDVQEYSGDSSIQLDHLQGDVSITSKWDLSTPKVTQFNMKDSSILWAPQQMRKAVSSYEMSNVKGSRVETSQNFSRHDLSDINVNVSREFGTSSNRILQNMSMGSQSRKVASLPTTKNKEFIQSIPVPVPGEKENLAMGRKRASIFGSKSSSIKEDEIGQNLPSKMNSTMKTIGMPLFTNSFMANKPPLNRSQSYQVKQSVIENGEQKRSTGNSLLPKKEEDFLVLRNLDTGELMTVGELEGSTGLGRQFSLRE